MDAIEKILGIDVNRYVDGLTGEDRDLFKRAELGVEVEAWLESNLVGRHLANMCEGERADALESLVEAMGKEDMVAARKAHRRVEICDLFKAWIVETIELGKEAERVLKQREAQEH